MHAASSCTSSVSSVGRVDRQQLVMAGDLPGDTCRGEMVLGDLGYVAARVFTCGFRMFLVVIRRNFKWSLRLGYIEFLVIFTFLEWVRGFHSCFFS